MYSKIAVILLHLATVASGDRYCNSMSDCMFNFEPYCCDNFKCCSMSDWIDDDESGISNTVETGVKIGVGIIIAIVVAIIILIVACIVGCVMCCKRSQNRGYVGRPVTAATTVHSAHHVMQPQQQGYYSGQPQQGHHPGQVPQPAPMHMPPGQPMGPPYSQPAYPPQGPMPYQPMPQPPVNPSGAPYPEYTAAPPAYEAQSPYPTKDSVQASAPPMP